MARQQLIHSIRPVRAALTLLTLVALTPLTPLAAARAADPDPAAIDAHFSQWNDHTPGAALAVVRDQKIIYSRGYGTANLDHSIPISTNTVFDIASTSKQFTAACILLLAEEGKLALTDEARKYIPELPAYDKPITLAHLLHHTSGLRDYSALLLLAGQSFEPAYSEKFLLDLICRQKGLNFPPGEQFSYCNTGYYLLGVVVSRVAGMPMSRFAKARIFDPLEMNSTRFADDHNAVIPHRAESYYPREDRPGEYQLSISLMDNVGDGGIYTTVEDLARWDANFYHNQLGAKSPEFLRHMHEIGLLNNGESTRYASGLFIGTHRGHRMVSHSGGWRGFRTEFVRFPDSKLSVICLSNDGSAHPTPLALRIADLYLHAAADEKSEAPQQPTSAAPSTAPTITLSDDDWPRFLGRYKADAGPVWTITRADNTLSIRSTTGLAFTARPIGPLAFESIDRPQLATLQFTVANDARINGLTQTIPGIADVRLTPIEHLIDPAVSLSDFEGTYDCEELGTQMKAAEKDNRLWFTSAGEPEPYDLERDATDIFSVWGFRATFTRGSDAKVNGFIMDAPPARGLRFVKRVSETNAR